jgi:hypothetical protein
MPNLVTGPGLTASSSVSGDIGQHRPHVTQTLRVEAYPQATESDRQRAERWSAMCYLTNPRV